jgi:dihydrofolate reductase
MRKVIVGVAISLDGFIEGPKGEYDWCLTDDDYGLSNFFKRVDALFIGRKTYDMMQGQEAPPGMPRFTSYVFSNTLQKVKEGEVLVRGNIEEEVRRIKEAPGKDIWLFGGASLTSTLMNLKLGSGKPLFQDLKDRVHLKLLDSKTYPSGLVSLSYELDEK